MTVAKQYAVALHSLLVSEPAKLPQYVTNLKEILARRGHSKLLPQITKELELLEQKKARSEKYKEVTPLEARNRTLLELYQRLIQTN